MDPGSATAGQSLRIRHFKNTIFIEHKTRSGSVIGNAISVKIDARPEVDGGVGTD